MKKNNVVDLRSDTITKPSPEMWEALKSMENSRLGDDVFREDPTVNELEEKAAKITGKEGALLVTSGTQGNLISLLSSTLPGDEILVESKSHIFFFEVGGAARIGGLTSRTYSSNKGMASLDNLQSLIRPRNDDHQPWTTLICVENSHNKHGGTVLTSNYLQDINKFSRSHDMKIHMDGARIFNAAIALKLPVTELSKHVDSMMFCLSKGLSCPIGSLVVGSQTFIEKARKFRKMVGGGMRQAGIIAIFGLMALQDKWLKRLEEDHKNAKRLAEGLSEAGLKTQVPETNIVLLECPNGAPINKIIANLSDEGVLTFSTENKLRLVTHYGVTKEDIDFSIDKIVPIMKQFYST
jgi:threonine aldolase